ncbi:hypothetical protein A2U01_0069562, partial [Trifolium medium]|nr:hypothetical protein [Trifolium medium]
ARIKGRDGRIRRTEPGHEEFLQRQAEQQDEEHVSVVHEEKQQAVQANEEPVPGVQQSWPKGPIDTSLLTRYHEHVARHVWFG